MYNVLQSMVLTEITRVADLSTHQALRIANWLLDHDMRFVSIQQPQMKAGVPVAVYNEAESLCKEMKYIQAIKFIRQYAADNNVESLKGLKEAKDWVDSNFGHLRAMPSRT